MEPISASLANSSSFATDPFQDDATTFIFGAGNTVGDNASANPSQTPTATAATSSGSGSSSAGAQVAGTAAGATASTPGGSGLNVGTLLLLAGAAFLAMHLLKK